MSRFLFALVTAVYFIRPAEWYPPLEGMPVYQCLIVGCILLSYTQVIRQLTMASLIAQPINACVVGLWFIALIANVMHPSTLGFTYFAVEFNKIAIYYFLLVALTDTEDRLRELLVVLVGVVATSAALVCAAHHGSFAAPTKAIAVMSGDVVRLRYLGGSSFDPNDLAAIMLIGIVPGMGLALDAHRRWQQILLIGAAALSAYCLHLTQSRGGLLALAAASGVFVYLRWGMRRFVLFALLAIPAAGAFLAGRMIEIGAIQTGTGQTRVQLWSSALLLFKQNPLFGIGPENFNSMVGRASHNSFFQAYAELGFLGGTFLSGAFAYGLYSLWRTIKYGEEELDVSTRNLLVTVFSLTCGVVTAGMALCHTYLISTYLVLGLLSVAVQLRIDYSSQFALPFGSRLLTRLAGFSLFFLVAGHIFCRLMVRWQ